MQCQAEDLNGYSFTLMYEKTASLRFLGRPSINSSGAIAFVDRGGFGIRVIDRESSRLIATEDEFRFINSAIINDRGMWPFMLYHEIAQNHVTALS
jgi:hypothetical protein